MYCVKVFYGNSSACFKVKEVGESFRIHGGSDTRMYITMAVNLFMDEVVEEMKL